MDHRVASSPCGLQQVSVLHSSARKSLNMIFISSFELRLINQQCVYSFYSEEMPQYLPLSSAEAQLYSCSRRSVSGSGKSLYRFATVSTVLYRWSQFDMSLIHAN